MTHGMNGSCTKPVRECVECMRAWLDRKPPPGSWRDLDTSAPKLDLQLKEALTG